MYVDNRLDFHTSVWMLYRDFADHDVCLLRMQHNRVQEGEKKREKISRALLGKPEVPWTVVQKARGIIRHQGARAAARRKHSPPRLPLFSRSVFWRLRSNMSRGSSSCAGFLFCSILPPHTHIPQPPSEASLTKNKEEKDAERVEKQILWSTKRPKKKVTFFKRFSHTFFFLFAASG